jgi:uncharacterized protein
MRWQDERRSENVEDRRGIRPAGVAVGGIGTLIIVLIALFLGADPRKVLSLLQNNAQPGAPRQAAGPPNPAEEKLADFVKVVLAETEDVWSEQFRKMNKVYTDPKLVLFTHSVATACGRANAAVGPFYCPADQQAYIDLSFYQELKDRFHAPGEFAEAYVIAHEIGHHVQNLLGVSDKVHALQARMSETDGKKLSVRLELQADFYAGVWAHHTQKMRNNLDRGDIESGLRAAKAIGDDRLQMESQGYVVPDSFTHGTSEQRMRWFLRGLQTGDMNEGDTFSAEEL